MLSRLKQIGAKIWRSKTQEDGYRISRNGFKKTYHIENPDIASYILKNEPSYPLGRDIKLVMQLMFGKSILSSDGADWKRIRDKLNPALLGKKVYERFTPIFDRQSERLIEKLLSESKDNKISMRELSSQFAFAVIGAAMLGKNASEHDLEKLMSVSSAGMSGGRISFIDKINYVMSSLGLAAILPKRAQKSPEDISEHAAELMRSLEKKRIDFISSLKDPDTLLTHILDIEDENGHVISAIDAFNNVNALMGTGFFTTSVITSLAMNKILEDEDLKERVIAEARSLNGDVFPEDYTSQFPTIINCIKETMRICPPVNTLERKANISHEFNKLSIPAGATIAIDVHHIHHNPAHFNNPEDFDPDRFLEPVKSNHFMPFGYGPRVCVGQRVAMMEATFMLQKLFSEYDISLDQSYGQINRTTFFSAPEGECLITLKPHS